MNRTNHWVELHGVKDPSIVDVALKEKNVSTKAIARVLTRKYIAL